MSYLNLLSIDTWTEVVVIVSIAFYLLQCYAGYKVIRWLVSVVGFVVGFFAGYFITLEVFNNRYLPVLIGLVAAIGLSLIAFKLYLVGIFIFCGTMAYSVASLIPMDEGTLKTVICIAAFVVVGILSIKFSKKSVILITSITGAINAVNQMRTPIAVFEDNFTVRVAAMVLLAVTGILVQKATTKRQ